jgi:4-aminobutyrate aminotransferase-like enzyme
MSSQITPTGQRDIRSLLHPMTNLVKHEEVGPFVVTRGEGIYVYDEHGQRYLEGMSGLWCASLGFSEKELVQAALRQMERLPYYHSFNHRASDPTIALADRLRGSVWVEPKQTAMSLPYRRSALPCAPAICRTRSLENRQNTSGSMRSAGRKAGTSVRA